MDFKIGIDSVEIERIAQSVKKDSFIRRVYGENELKELRGRNMPAQSAAACFCAKEAFSKAIGTGVTGFNLNEVETLHDEKGKPFLVFSGEAKRIVEESGLSFDISITHTDSTATAVVIAFKN